MVLGKEQRTEGRGGKGKGPRGPLEGEKPKESGVASAREKTELP